MIYGKSELFRKLSDIAKKGWSNTQVRDLIDSLWRDHFSLRTSGFNLPGGTDADIDIYGSASGSGSGSGESELVFSIAPVVAKFSFYQYRYMLTYHKKYAEELINIPTTEGLHFIYYDFDPVSKEEMLHVSSPPYLVTPGHDWLIVNRCMVASVYWDAYNQEEIVFNDMRYGSEWNPQMHKTLRNTLGSLRDYGLTLSDMVPDGDGDSDSHGQFSIVAGAAWHGDIYRISAGTAVGATIKIMYFDEANNSRIVTNPGWPVMVGNLLQYQAAGTLIDATEGYFILYHIFFTNCLYNEFISIPGLYEYENLSEAVLNLSTELEEIKSLLPYTDVLLVGSLLYQTSAEYGNTIHSRIVNMPGFVVITDKSVTGDGSQINPITLENDEKTPGLFKFYNTDGAGNRGWHELDPRMIGGGQSIYLHSDDSDVSGYKKALPVIPDHTNATYQATANNTSGEVLIKAFVTELNYPGLTAIPAGPWVFEHFMAVTSSDHCSVVVRVYLLDIFDQETELFNFEQPITAVGITVAYKVLVQDLVPLDIFDRLVFKYYFKTESITNRTMLLGVEGDEPESFWWSNVRLPLPSAAVVNEGSGSGSEEYEDYVEEVFVEQDPQFPIEYLKYTKGGIDYDVTEIAKANGLVWGGQVSWIELLSFLVGPSIYYLAGVLYKILTTTTKTLDAADPDNPRRDVLAIDNTETVIIIKGTPAADPQKPTVDPETQIELTEILILAGATEPVDIVTDIIYDENTEWTGAGSGVTVDFDNATSPFHGTKCASVGSIDNNDTVIFTAPVPIELTSFTQLVICIKLKAYMSNQHNLYVAWMNGGIRVSNELVIPLGKGDFANWQGIMMQLSAWTYIDFTVDALRFRWSKTGSNAAHAGFYLDFVKFESGIVQPVTSNQIHLKGDVLGDGATGPGGVETTLKVVNSNIGQFGDATNVPKITVDAKGRVIAIENVGITIPPAITPTSDPTPADTDEVVSLRGTSWLKTTWTVLKAFLKTYFDGLYSVLGHAHTFISLTDVPAAYTGQAGKYPKVNAGENALEFDTPGGAADEKVKYDEADATAGYLTAKLAGVDAAAVDDADTFNFYQVANTILKKITWANIKSTLKTYFDTLYKPKTILEPIAFDFNDATGAAQTWTLDIKAEVGYTIDSVCLETDAGTLTGVAIKINATGVGSCDNLTVDTAVDETAATAPKTVIVDDRVYLYVGGKTGSPTCIRGKIKRTAT